MGILVFIDEVVHFPRLKQARTIIKSEQELVHGPAARPLATLGPVPEPARLAGREARVTRVAVAALSP